MTTAGNYFYAFSEDILEVNLHEPPAHARDVPEALIHDLWEHQRFETGRLQTVDDVPLTVLDPGRLNTDAGPDFLNARLRLGSTLWSGAVEIHATSGIWLDHGHDNDPRYNSTVLHAVLYNDIWTGKLRREDGTLLPEVVLYPYLGVPVRRLIHSFYTRPARQIYCASGWNRVPDDVRSPYLAELALERILEKKRHLAAAGAAEIGLYHNLFAGLGYSKNAGAMRTLARLVSLENARSLSDPQDIEALYLGVAGLIPAPADLLNADRVTADYAIDLKDRFDRINHRFEIDPMPETAWRFFRLRPANFPPLRIAQAASLLRPDAGLLRENPMGRLATALEESRPLQALRSLFDVALPPFWTSHVRLDRRSSIHSSAIGRDRIDALLVNAVVPSLARDDRGGSAFQLLEQLGAAEDEVIRPFVHLGTTPAHALEAQGLHQLFRTRCREAKCLSCAIGRHLLADGE